MMAWVFAEKLHTALTGKPSSPSSTLSENHMHRAQPSSIVQSGCGSINSSQPYSPTLGVSAWQTLLMAGSLEQVSVTIRGVVRITRKLRKASGNNYLDECLAMLCATQNVLGQDPLTV